MSIFLGTNQVDNIIKINNIYDTNDIESWFNRTIVTIYDSRLTTITPEAFYSCSSLKNISFLNCVYIDLSAFTGCSKLTLVNFPNCSIISHDAFRTCTSLSYIYFPVCKVIHSYAFYGCTSLQTIYFPICSRIASNAFSSCRRLTSINFPEVLLIESNAFRSCSSLTTASFPICNNISNNAFSGCYNLISLYLNSVSSVPSLGTSVFNSTPIGGYSTSAGQYGSVYVPASLYSSFLTATNWSSISARIVSI